MKKHFLVLVTHEKALKLQPLQLGYFITNYQIPDLKRSHDHVGSSLFGSVLIVSIISSILPIFQIGRAHV